MLTLEEAKENVGRAVIYESGPIKDRGEITSVNSSYVFVRYSVTGQGVATNPANLTFENDAV